MKKHLLLLLIIFVGQVHGQTWQWAKSGSRIGSNGTLGCEGYSVNTDTTGNVFVTGAFSFHKLSFDSDTLTNNGFINVFIAKYDASGNVLWAKSSGGTGNDAAYSLSTDVSGNVFLSGRFNSPTIIFGTYTLTNTGGANAFIAKYDVNGNVLWAKSAIGTGDDEADAVSTDASGNVFVTGKFSSQTITLNTYTFTNAAFSGHGYNQFIAKYDMNGNLLWAKNGTGTLSVIGNSVSTDASVNVFVSGFYQGNATFDTYTLTGTGNPNLFIAKYDPNGNILWAKSEGSGGTGHYGTLSTDASGNVFLTGDYNSPATFGTYTLTYAGSNSNMFIAKYDANGNALWVKSSSGASNAVGYSTSTDVTGNVFISGGFFGSSTIAFDNDTLVVPSSSPDPMFIIKYDANGNVLCASALTSGGDDQNGVSADRFGNAFIGGDFVGNSFIVGSTTLTQTFSGENVFVAKWEANCNTAANIEQFAHNDINIYPNPTSDQFLIEINTTDKLIVDVYDVNGRHVFSASVSDKENINIATLDNGVYTLTIKSADSVTKKKLVIVH